MTTILSTTSQAATPSIGAALRELAGAAARVIAACRATLFPAADQRPLSAYEEAEHVRAMAFACLKTDRAFANDLFAAAQRHELLHGAQFAAKQ